MIDKTKLLLPFELEYKIGGLWHPYGRYENLEKARWDRSEAIGLDMSNGSSYEYRILETRVIE